MARNFKESMADQDYKANQSASICQNCLHLETAHIPGNDNQRPITRSKCGIGRFFIERTHTCRVFEAKPVAAR